MLLLRGCPKVTSLGMRPQTCFEESRPQGTDSHGAEQSRCQGLGVSSGWPMSTFLPLATAGSEICAWPDSAHRNLARKLRVNCGE